MEFLKELNDVDTQMNVAHLLRKKRDGEEFTTEEISLLVRSLVSGCMSESQIGALLMAMYIRGITEKETVDLTQSMVLSGIQLRWNNPQWKGLVVEKHSTGGVGDKISLILAPVMAACGFKMPMISGRSLEHTGGTLDKMESIPGFIVDLDQQMMEEALEYAGCFISAATSQLCPADKVLYQVRDITSTVDNINLIVSSIISKKVASGAKYLVIDLKVGQAAFFKTVDPARKLAKQLINVSAKLGLTTQVVLTRMDEPLGNAVGNSLEVAEAVQCLTGNMHPTIFRLITVLGTKLLEMTNYKGNAETLIARVLKDGSAKECFRKMLIRQGVNEEVAQQLMLGRQILPTAKHKTEFTASMSGWVSKVNALTLGQVCLGLGAGRVKSTDIVDPSVGVVVSKHKGDTVTKGEVWLTVHHNTDLQPYTIQNLNSAIIVEKREVTKSDVFIEVIT